MASWIGAFIEESECKMKRPIVLTVRPSFFGSIPQKNYNIFPIILDTHSVYHILCDLLYFPRKRAFMTDQENRGAKKPDPPPTSQVDSQTQEEVEQLKKDSTISPERSQTQEELKRLKLFAVATLTSFGAFVIFVFILKCSDILSDNWPARLVAWILTALAGICCISLGVKSAVGFLKYLFSKRE